MIQNQGFMYNIGAVSNHDLGTTIVDICTLILGAAQRTPSFAKGAAGIIIYIRVYAFP
jgi:hypothetical protein